MVITKALNNYVSKLCYCYISKSKRTGIKDRGRLYAVCTAHIRTVQMRRASQLN